MTGVVAAAADEHPGAVSWSQMRTSPGRHLSPQMKESQDPERERDVLRSHAGRAGGPDPCPVFWVFPGWAGFLRPLELQPGWLEPSSAVTRPGHWFLWLFPSCSLGLQEQSLFPGVGGGVSHSLPSALGWWPLTWVLSAFWMTL